MDTNGESRRTPEFDVLCRLVGFAVHGRASRLGAGGSPELDESRLIQLSVRHRCLPLMVLGLNRISQQDGAGGAPLRDTVMSRVGKTLAMGAGRSAFLAVNLGVLFKEFGSAGVRAIALKGPAMSQMLYGSEDVRPADDLDIWVHPRDFMKACGLIEALGFRPLVQLSTVEAVSHMRAGWDRAYRSPAGDYVVELCTGIAPRYFARLPDAGALWSEARETNLEGAVVMIPSPTHMIELLCIHGAKHRWSRLLWVADVAALGIPGAGVDWDVLRRRARQQGTERMIALGLGLARMLLGSTVEWRVPPRDLQARCLHILAGTDEETGAREEWSFHLKARERWRDRIRCLLLAALTPSFGDWRWLPLPPKLSWLHWLVRPVRLMSMALRKTLNSP